MKKESNFKIGAAFFAAMLLFVCVVGCAKAAKKPQPEEMTTAVYIVYTDEDAQHYAVQTNPLEGFYHADKAEPAFNLTDAECETVARIVAGQAAEKCMTAQTMIANVMYNQMLANGGKIEGTEYATCGRNTPTEATYAAVDAIFKRGEFLLDDTVLWTDNAENPDEWHQTLRMVTTCDGIAFYEERK